MHLPIISRWKNGGRGSEFCWTIQRWVFDNVVGRSTKILSLFVLLVHAGKGNMRAAVSWLYNGCLCRHPTTWSCWYQRLFLPSGGRKTSFHCQIFWCFCHVFRLWARASIYKKGAFCCLRHPVRDMIKVVGPLGIFSSWASGAPNAVNKLALWQVEKI